MARSYEDPMLSYECDLTRERDELLAALQKSADTFADLSKGLRLLNRPLIADACDLAERETRAVIEKATSAATSGAGRE